MGEEAATAFDGLGEVGKKKDENAESARIDAVYDGGADEDG